MQVTDLRILTNEPTETHSPHNPHL